jgi:cohesin complex subunit SA-1/2
VLDRTVPDESHTVALAKTLSSSFVVRGPQLSIVQRLGSQFAVQIHTQLLTWIAKKLTVYENNKNKKGRNTAALFFRVLMPLITAIDARDALKM